MKPRLLLIICLAMALVTWGCNLFSPFYSEGDSDDPEALLSDARGALRDGRPQEALNMLERAKATLPPNAPTSALEAEILYFHAVATVRANNISFQQFIDMMQATSSTLAKGTTPAHSTQDEIILFDFSTQDLADLLRIFSIVQADLAPVVQALRNGIVPSAQFVYADDVYLSCGVASLVAGFILMLDQDHNPMNGFQLDARLSIRKLNDTYQLLLADPFKTAEQIRQDTQTIIKISYDPMLINGLKCLWYYYHWSTFGRLTRNDSPLPPAPLPTNLRDTASGIFFQVVYLGLSALHHYAYGG